MHQLNSIVNDFIDEAVLGSVLEVHRGLKQAQLCLNCDPMCVLTAITHSR